MDIERIISETFVARAEHHAVLGSTNDLARQYNGSRLPLLIIADRQTAGRGRGANRWWTGEGSLAFSLLLPADMFPGGQACPPLAGLAAAVAIVKTVEPLLYAARLKTASSSHDAVTAKAQSKDARGIPDQGVSIHWPNDVYVGGRKLAGILIEVLSDRRHVLGIGLNANNSSREAPVELRQKAVALRDLIGRPLDRTDVLIALLSRLEKQLDRLAESPAKVAQEAGRLCGQVGQSLVIKMGTKTERGRCLGIADDGGLMLATPDGQRTFHSGTLP